MNRDDRAPGHELNAISHQIIAAAISVHRALGPGLLESVYETCMEAELDSLGLPCLRQVSLPLKYRNVTVPNAFKLDFLVADAVVVEVKSVEALKPVHKAQLLTYLRLSGLQLGLLINFKERVLTKGVRRLVNDFPQAA